MRMEMNQVSNVFTRLEQKMTVSPEIGDAAPDLSVMTFNSLSLAQAGATPLKEAIHEMLSSEDKGSPLSDEGLARAISQRLQISVETSDVFQARIDLNIPPAAERCTPFHTVEQK